MSTIMENFAGAATSNSSSFGNIEKSEPRVRKILVEKNTPAQIQRVNFGIAAKSGKGIRSGLKPVLPNPTDRIMQGRFQGAIASWLGSSAVGELSSSEHIPFVDKFQFIKDQDFKDMFKVPMVVQQPQENLITVRIDAFTPRSAIVAPAGTTSVELVISVAGCMLHGGTPTGNKTINVIIPFNKLIQKAEVVKFPIHMPVGSLTVTAARLIYHGKKNNLVTDINNAAFLSAGVLNARYSF